MYESEGGVVLVLDDLGSSLVFSLIAVWRLREQQCRWKDPTTNHKVGPRDEEQDVSVGPASAAYPLCSVTTHPPTPRLSASSLRVPQSPSSSPHGHRYPHASTDLHTDARGGSIIRPGEKRVKTKRHSHDHQSETPLCAPEERRPRRVYITYNEQIYSVQQRVS
ncbi:hypothetical protein B0H12DRAFT_274098 [Mycena haematopus]|nr:hypothetical protein B0H12DRAFT_274098 [Mycena haematopus]